MFNELVKYDSKSTLSKNFFEFYRNYESFLAKMKLMMSKMEKELIEPINLFSKHLTSKYNECLGEYKTLAYSTFESKKILEKSKHKYFDACKSAVEQEKVVLKKMDEQVSDMELEAVHDTLIKLRLQAENHCQSYKGELSKTNKQFEENEKKYFPLIDKMKNNEEARENFLKFHFEKFTVIMEEFSVSLLEMVNRMSNDVHRIKIEDDMKIVDEKLNFLYKSNERIRKEEFLNYEIYRRNLEKMLTGVNSIGSNVSSNVNSFTTMSNDEESNNSITINNITVPTFYTNSKTGTEIEVDEFTRFFLKLKNSDCDVTSDEVTKLLTKLEDNLIYSKNFIDKILVHYKSNVFVDFLNCKNLHHFASILLTITKNTQNKKELFEMNFAIIYISGKTFYINPDNNFNKLYLCNILSKNKIYSERKFWMDLINIKINSLIENKINQEIQKREKENSLSSGYQAHYGSNELTSPRKGFMTIGSKLKNIFSQSIINENKKVESSMIQSHLYEQIKSDEATNVVKEYIVHFSNFNYDVSEAIDIIVEMSNVYNYEKEKVSYFISLLNSNYFTVKNKPLEEVKPSNYEQLFFSKDFKSYQKLNDNLISTVVSSMKYLPIKDYASILTLNKNFHKKLKKIVYKNILFKYHHMDNDTRLKIWRSLLNVVKNI
jgi:hypothetical protein